MDTNSLYYGDNLDVLRRHVKDESVDLIYLDPPFKSSQDYNVLFAERDGSRAAAQIKAFGDTWRWDKAAAAAYQETVELGGKVSQAMQAFRKLLGDSDMLAYLAMMAPRLVELHGKLKPTGSIYLHCDPTASHYLKLLLDAVFDGRNFRNEIIWKYQKYQKQAMGYFTRNSDRILWYVKDQADYVFNPQSIKLDTPKRYLKRVWDKETGRIVNAKDKSGKVQYITVDTQKVDDVWMIPYLMPASRERLGYPTQKPEALLERIINASSNPGHVVLDPFCGCGTAIAVAQRLDRRWIGIDITYPAISLIKNRMKDAFGDKAKYRIIGEPTSLPDAEALAKHDPYHFQWWALGLVGARPVEQKKGADKGVDGRLYFHEHGAESGTRQIILSVKAGHTGPDHLRDLRGVVDREDADIGVFLTMKEPTKPMRTEAAGGGFYTDSWSGERYPRLQILTVADLLDGKTIEYPRYRENVTFRKAPRAKKAKGQTLALPLDEDAAEAKP